MWQQIALNKRNSFILLTLMLLLLLILGAAFGVLTIYSLYSSVPLEIQDTTLLLQSAQNGIIVAFVIWVILFLVALTNGKRAILAINHAYKLPENAHMILENVVEEMSIASGLPKIPDIYVIDTPMPNAFATGLNPKNAAVAVTTGLLVQLNRDELQGVIAHEIAHIVNRDTMYMIYAGVMIGTIVYLSEIGLRMLGKGARSRRRAGGKGDVIILVFCIILMIIAPIVAQLLYFSISQKREYLADACAVQFTRYPQGLASALAKISSSLYVFRDADKITSAMYIVHPLDYEIQYKNTYSMFGSLFSTHPPTEKRIEVLSKMVGADFNAYNEAFKKVSRTNRTILSKEFLYGVQPLKIEKPEEKETIYKNPTAAIAGTVAGIALASQMGENSNINEKIIRKRDAEELMYKANNYIFKECECGTKFKFPADYKGQDIQCPHCKKIISVT